ncbi:MAG: acylphosphatase [Blautia sp.]|nr:acylphosphatase [Blautia sp.]
MAKVRRQLFFSGTVQGVGFRYRAMYLAQSHGLTGWVRNLWDGRVQMQLQGEERAINDMVEALQNQRFISVEDIESYELPLEEERSFKVR